ncbi:MAG: glycerophosphodiester phosphodiesterase [Spirochaetia bacterium]|jgi:glycerophosphoryl diester phosphodiesterase|nr:glycerophosphodiester phosphodiesterase [Spirochaetia bacterium]
MITFAHRGFSGEYPENTMLAFEKAYESGCEGIELDVHLSKDGHLVVIHDESVDRTTDKTGFVKDFLLSELTTMNAGTETSFEGIPSFEEYCIWVKDLPLITNIEIKTNRHYYPGIEEKVIQMVKSFHLEKKVLVSSFNHASLWKVKTLDPCIECAMLVNSKGIGNAGSYAKAMGMEAFHPDGTTLTEEVVKGCHSQGIKVNVWTVDDMALLKKVTKWGVDGIITNFCDVVKLYIENHRECAK